VAIWYTLGQFGKIFAVLVCCTYQEKSGNPDSTKLREGTEVMQQ
jgi:hypothetical protein